MNIRPPMNRSKLSTRGTRWLTGVMLVGALLAGWVADGLQISLLSLSPNGTLVWTNDQTNFTCAAQFTPSLGQAWQSAPPPYNAILVTNLSNSLVLPLATLESSMPQLFFRLTTTTNAVASSATYDVDSLGIPTLATAQYIDLASISTISRFRSGDGHDYSDDFEHCRSMKHYFYVATNVNPNTVSVYAPVTGVVASLSAETTPDSGTQIWITPTNYPAFSVILFHINPTNTLSVGSQVVAGQQLGWFGGAPGGVSASDIAIRVATPGGTKLVSYFDTMTTNVFAAYAPRGITNVTQVIISQQERDSNALQCDGEVFLNRGTLTNEVVLTPAGE